MPYERYAGAVASVAAALMVAGCWGDDTYTPEQNVKPAFVGTITKSTYDGNTDDLLTAGLGKTGLAGASPPIANATAPTAAELRRLAIYNNYRALLDIARSDQWPTVQAGAGAGRARVSERSATPLPPGSPTIGDTRSVSLQAAYEVDLWGRYRDASEAARARLEASRYARAVVELAVASEVVRSYFDLRALDSQIELTRRTLQTRTAGAVFGWCRSTGTRRPR